VLACSPLILFYPELLAPFELFEGDYMMCNQIETVRGEVLVIIDYLIEDEANKPKILIH
jgi:hypothetical protein